MHIPTLSLIFILKVEQHRAVQSMSLKLLFHKSINAHIYCDVDCTLMFALLNVISNSRYWAAAVDYRALVHIVNEVHGVDKTNILQSYVKVW